ncbi:general transcription factor 3C polypeptide 3-like [Uloborus diversus]|uniref:general transcription factor 3C polypeptide 3-like n=1 Tax=Uloborus diversus TaxID=327109 RepID=UPI002409E4D3|nr:general transcription factor 3C polypeptide 3-like [Uloborus diversus]
MNYDPLEGTSELFASVLGDVPEEEWESFKEQQSKLGMLVVGSDSEDDSDFSDRSISPTGDEEFVTNFEVVEEDVNESGSEASDAESSNEGTSWGCDAAFKYVNGEISFSELSEIIENDKFKAPPRKKMRKEKEEVEPRPLTQLEKEDQEYQMELKNKKKRTRRKMCHLPKELEGLMGAANLNFAKGNTEDAIKMCMELIRTAPTAQEPFQTLGVIYEELGEPKKSFQCYLVAAYLNPSDTDEWIRLAELCLEQNQLQLAISCYTQAIRNEPSNVNFVWERCNLYEQIGDRKKALLGYEQILRHLSNPEDGQTCVDMSREIAKVHHGNNDFVNAIKVLETAFNKFPSLITSEDVNFLLELQLSQKFYKAAVKNFVQHCGVKLEVPGKEISSCEEISNFSEEDFNSIAKCYVPEVLPIDLFVKVLVCLIHLKALTAVKPMVESLKKENAEEIGDLFLDVAEAFMDNSEHQLATPLLQKLLATTSYDLPAVWMRYADCMFITSTLEDAIKAYQKVIKLAPSYQEARLALSKIYLDMGQVQEATNVLRQEYEEGGEGSAVGIEALYQRCKLLEAEERWEEYVSAAILLQYSHCVYLETDEEFNAVLTNQTLKRKIEVLRELKSQPKKSCPEFVGQNISVTEMWDIFQKVCQKLLEMKRFEELQTISLSILTSSMFMKNPDYVKEIEFQALLSCVFNKSHYYAYILVKDLVLKHINNPKAWNLFALIVTYCQENRHNRFCLRLMMKHQDHLALGVLNGHNAMISGTYKHALGEYMCILKERPNDVFVTFCVGITFIHMACQKFATKRQFLMIQGFAFLSQYLKLKGPYQETFYNIGRALHQLGIKDAAVHYYKKALIAPVIIKDQEVFDLRREIAYNLCLIYQSVGATDLAYVYSRKYIIV